MKLLKKDLQENNHGFTTYEKKNKKSSEDEGGSKANSTR